MVIIKRYFQQYFSYIMVVRFIGGGNQSTPKKNTDLSQVTDKLYHKKLYTSPWSRLELTTSVVIVTDCIGSCKSNYHKNALLNWYIFISLDKGWGVWTSYHGEFKDT